MLHHFDTADAYLASRHACTVGGKGKNRGDLIGEDFRASFLRAIGHDQ